MRHDNDLLQQCEDLDDGLDCFRGIVFALVLTGLGILIAVALFGN
jgi:hypothetical protein